MIPEGWRLVSLGDCFEFKNGINADKDSYGHGVNFVNVMDVFASRELRYENLINSVSVTDKQKKDYSVLRGDVLFNRTSEVVEEIAFASVYCDDEPAVFGGFVIRGRRKGQSISERFSVYLFGSSSFRRQAIKSCQGVVRGNIGQKDLAKISLYLPPLNEQKKIASILSTWDEAITTSERLIEASQQQRHALMQQLLTGKRRLPGFAVHVGWRHEKYGDVPNDWGFVEIGSFSRQSSGKNRETEELPVLSCSKYDGFVDSLSYFNKRVYSEDLSGYKVIYRGDIGFPSNHVEEGSIGLQNLYDRGLVSPIYVVFRPDEERVDPEFLFRLLKTDHYRQVFAASTNASVDRRGSLRWKEFSAIKVPLPSLDEQKAIAKVLSQADAEIEAQQRRLDCLRQEKKALMQQLLTGKRRVKVEATAPTEEAAC